MSSHGSEVSGVPVFGVSSTNMSSRRGYSSTRRSRQGPTTYQGFRTRAVQRGQTSCDGSNRVGQGFTRHHTNAIVSRTS